MFKIQQDLLIWIFLCLLLLLISNAEEILNDIFPKDDIKSIKKILPNEHIFSDDYLRTVYHTAIRRMTKNAKTLECKHKIEMQYMRYIRSVSQESAFPFEDTYYHSQCPNAYKRHMPVLPLFIKKRESGPLGPPPPKRLDANSNNITTDNLSILYVILVHIHPKFTIKLINALDEPQHTFVIHVDIKSQESYVELLEFSKTRSNIFVIDKDKSKSLTWGGFSIVNATLISLKYGFNIGRHFDWFINLSGTTYPIQHKSEIRKKLAVNPNSVYMDVHGIFY